MRGCRNDPGICPVSSPFDVVSTYFAAKDGNRPHLLRRAFAQEAELEMAVNTDAISFPSSAKGLDAIESILVRRFADVFENVYTFGLTLPTAASRLHFPCYWLVGMSAKNDGPVRVGCGLYNWYFTSEEPCLVSKLIITIERMEVLPERRSQEIFDWLSGLPYPWCPPDTALATMPDNQGLSTIKQYLNEVNADSPHFGVPSADRGMLRTNTENDAGSK
jgi:hypothetical protein